VERGTANKGDETKIVGFGSKTKTTLIGIGLSKILFGWDDGRFEDKYLKKLERSWAIVNLHWMGLRSTDQRNHIIHVLLWIPDWHDSCCFKVSSNSVFKS